MIPEGEWFECPFCAGRFAPYSLGGYVAHSVPPCERFQKQDEDALDFVRAARAAYGLPDRLESEDGE